MLNAKQEKFIQNLVKGMSQREAYKRAYNAKYKDEAIDTKACALFNLGKVKNRYMELIKRIEDKSIMTAEERQIWLSKVIKGDVKVTSSDDEKEFEPFMSDKLKALDILNKMSGEYVTKIDADINADVNISIELTDD